MNGFKEDNSAVSGVEKMTDRENKIMNKRNPVNRRKAFETDREMTNLTSKRDRIRDLGRDSSTTPNDKLFFQLYAKVANEVTDEEDE